MWNFSLPTGGRPSSLRRSRRCAYSAGHGPGEVCRPGPVMTSPGAVALLAVAVFVDGLLEPQPATARIKASAASAPAIARKPGRTGRLRISLWPRVGTGRTVSQRDPVQIKGRAQRAARVSEGTRTPDRLDHNQELYQLSYAHHASGPKSSVGSMLRTRLALQLSFGQRELLLRVTPVPS